MKNNNYSSNVVAIASMQQPLVEKKKKWAFPLCSCLNYGPCFPMFCPVAVLCTGWYVGSIVSKLHDEPPCCFQLGCRGCCCCLATIPLHFGSPLGGLSMFVCLSCYLRPLVIEKWNVEEDEKCCCGPLNPCLEAIHVHCNYPCSFYQMLMSIREWEKKPGIAIPVATPIHS